MSKPATNYEVLLERLTPNVLAYLEKQFQAQQQQLIQRLEYQIDLEQKAAFLRREIARIGEELASDSYQPVLVVVQQSFDSDSLYSRLISTAAEKYPLSLLEVTAYEMIHLGAATPFAAYQEVAQSLKQVASWFTLWLEARPQVEKVIPIDDFDLYDSGQDNSKQLQLVTILIGYKLKYFVYIQQTLNGIIAAELPKKPETTLQWKGENTTEFIQLVYALFHSGRLTNSKNQVTKVVEELASFLQVELGDRWQDLLSKSVNKNNRDYQPPIFEHLRQSYQAHVTEKLNKPK